MTQHDPARRPDPQKLVDLAGKVADDLDVRQYFFSQIVELDVQRSHGVWSVSDEPTSSILNRISLESPQSTM